LNIIKNTVYIVDELLNNIPDERIRFIISFTALLTWGYLYYFLNKEDHIINEMDLLIDQNRIFLWRGHELRFGVINDDLLRDLFRPRFPIMRVMPWMNRIVVLDNNNWIDWLSLNNASSISTKSALSKYSEISPFHMNE